MHTPISRPRRARIATFAALAVSAVLLTSCSQAAIPESAPTPSASVSSSADASASTAPSAEPSESATPEEPDPALEIPNPLTFAAGAELDPELIPQWNDPYLVNPDFSVSAADDGNGGWSYLHGETQCVISFWQGRLELGEADDSALSDLLLANRLGADAAQISQQAADLPDAYQTHVGGTVDARMVMGKDPSSGATGIYTARSFGAQQTGVAALLGCPAGQDSQAMWARLVTEYNGLTLMMMPLLG